MSIGGIREVILACIRKLQLIISCLRHFEEIIPRIKPFSTYRVNFNLNYAFDQTEMNLKKVREVFVPHRSIKEKFLMILHRYHGFLEMLKIQVLHEVCCISGVTLGKSSFLLDGVSKIGRAHV